MMGHMRNVRPPPFYARLWFWIAVWIAASVLGQLLARCVS